MEGSNKYRESRKDVDFKQKQQWWDWCLEDFRRDDDDKVKNSETWEVVGGCQWHDRDSNDEIKILEQSISPIIPIGGQGSDCGVFSMHN